ncbi:MAG TPA: hypothetical protein VNV43_01040 [Candidatus Acidoferrales bacterium]|nr:hypothetical protein [Candidatus Acidoferrales bacterium]
MKTFFILAALLFSAQWLFAQETQSPLPLYISGSGKIVPFQDGQMLDDGRDFVMTAVPNKGYVFASWQQVNIFTFDEYFLNSNGQLIEQTSAVPSFSPPEPEKNRVLHFTMQPEQYLFDDPNVRIITQSVGWQANFVPAPRKQHGK